jgi:hypothetical protein
MRTVVHCIPIITTVIAALFAAARICCGGPSGSSAARYARQPGQRHRFVGNVLIAVGALLPGIGGGATRFGHVEVPYVTELIGLVLILAGYRRIVGGPAPPSVAAVGTRPRSGP